MYLVRKKKPKTRHIWTGYDTVCRMYSTGGLRKNSYKVEKESDLPICTMCSDRKPVLPGESPVKKWKSLSKSKISTGFSEAAVAKAVREKIDNEELQK